MDQVKIGKFIAQCRREQDKTQRQLAEELGISDKTVSKWETGRGLPEASYMVPLCDTLGITVNELLSGERIPEDQYQEKAEDVMVALIEKKVEETNRELWIKVKSESLTAGAALAMIISYHANASVWWAIFHGMLGWIYVVYHLLRH